MLHRHKHKPLTVHDNTCAVLKISYIIIIKAGSRNSPHGLAMTIILFTQKTYCNGDSCVYQCSLYSHSHFTWKFREETREKCDFYSSSFCKVFFSRHYLLVKKWSLHRALKTEGGSVQCGGDEGNNDAILFLWLMLYVTLKMILFSLSSCNILGWWWWQAVHYLVKEATGKINF